MLSFYKITFHNISYLLLRSQIVPFGYSSLIDISLITKKDFVKQERFLTISWQWIHSQLHDNNIQKEDLKLFSWTKFWYAWVLAIEPHFLWA